jgi:polyphenol oxidase
MLIYPDWPAPANVHAISSSRLGGVSKGNYDGLNLAQHVQDDAKAVMQNRLCYQQLAQMPTVPLWLNQVHGIEVAELTPSSKEPITADACITVSQHHICTVLTADCLPLLICDSEGKQVAAIHAGWRGLAAGIIERTIARFSQPKQLLVWLGPAISQAAFEVGPEVRTAFIQQEPKAADAFLRQANGKYLADLYQLARQRLHAVGVSAIYGGDYCTYQQAELFYSYRRDGETGRMASSIWFD